MKVTVKLAQKVRAYDLVLDTEAKDLHFKLIMNYIERGIDSPRGGQSGPLLTGDRMVVPGKFRMIFFLAEEVCDEYEIAMGIK